MAYPRLDSAGRTAGPRTWQRGRRDTGGRWRQDELKRCFHARRCARGCGRWDRACAHGLQEGAARLAAGRGACRPGSSTGNSYRDRHQWKNSHRKSIFEARRQSLDTPTRQILVRVRCAPGCVSVVKASTRVYLETAYGRESAANENGRSERPWQSRPCTPSRYHKAGIAR